MRSTPKAASKKLPALTATSLKSLIKAGTQEETPERRFTVTPAIAKLILEQHNPKNRSINEPHLASLVRDIRNGNWVESTGTMISFARNGQLIDGQHRLGAIVRTGTPLRLSLKFGLDEAAQRVIDTGRKRTYSDFIAMTEGLDAKYKTERASVTRLLYGFLRDQSRPHVYTNNNKPTQSDLYEVAVEFNDDISGAVSTTLGPGQIHKIIIGSYAAFIYILTSHSVHGDRAKEFIELLATGANMEADDPIMVVRNRLMTRDEFRSQKTKDRTIGLVIKGWNHWIRGDKVSSKMHNPDSLPPVAGLTQLGSHKLYG